MIVYLGLVGGAWYHGWHVGIKIVRVICTTIFTTEELNEKVCTCQIRK